MAKKYQIQVQLDDADAERKLRALAGLFGNVDRAARGFADRASKAARDAAGGPGMAATVAKTSQQFRDLGRSFAATHTAFAGLNDDARKFGAAFVQVVNTQVGPALDRVKRQADAALGGGPMVDARMRAWQKQLDRMTPGERAAFDAEVAARAKARAGVPDYKAASDAIRAKYYAGVNAATAAATAGATGGAAGGGGPPRGPIPGEGDEEPPKVDVGYYKVVADSLKKQIKDRDAAAAERVKLEQRADSLIAKHAAKEYQADQKARAAAEKETQRRVADRVKLEERADALIAKQAAKEYQSDQKAKAAAEREKQKAVDDRARVERAADALLAKEAAKEYKADRKAKADAEREKLRAVADREKVERAADALLAKEAAKEYKADVRAKDKAAKEKADLERRADDFVARHQRKEIEAKLKEEQRFQDGFLKNLTDREVKQVVSNEKVKRSNDQRVAAAMKAAGLEKSGMDGIVKSLGMMVARFAVYHLAIGKATQLFKGMADAIKDAQQEQDRLLKGFVDDRAENRKIAKQLGLPNDNAFEAKILGMSTAASTDRGDVREFLKSLGAGGVARIGDTVTREQYLDVAEKAIRFTHARDMDMGAAAMMLGESLGAEDVRGKGAAGSRKAFENFAEPFLILERGKGKDARLAEQFAEFHSSHGQQFRSLRDEAIFQSIVAEGKPLGSTAAASRSFLEQLENPNAKAIKGLRKVRLADGTPLMKGDDFSKEMIGQEKMEAIRDWMDRTKMTDLQRSEFLGETFSVKTGLAAARQYFGTRSRAIEADRRKFADAEMKGLGDSMARDEAGEDMRREKERVGADNAAILRGAGKSPIAVELERARRFRQQRGIPGSTRAGIVKKVFDVFGFGAVDTSEEVAQRVTAQELLKKEIAARNPDFLKTYKGFGYNVLSTPEYRDEQLLKLIRERDRLNALGGGAGGEGNGPRGQPDVVAAIGKVEAAVKDLKNGAAAAPAPAPGPVPPGRAPGQNMGGGILLEGFLN